MNASSATTHDKEEFQAEIPTLVPQEPNYNARVELLSGTLAGVSSCVLFYPLECIEAKLQVSSAIKKRNGGGAVTTTLPKSPFDIARLIFRQDGIKGFYQGVTPTAIGNAVNWGIYFSIYRYANHWWNKDSLLHNKNTQAPWIGHAFSAIMAGVITTTVVNPFWVLKIRLATSNRYSGMNDAFKSILRNEGVAGFWKGIGPSYIGVSEGLVQFVSYEYILDKLKNPAGKHSVSSYLFAGGTARLIAGLVTYPYLLVRSSLQSDNCPYSSTGDAIIKIYRNEGLKGFYKGIGPNLARSIPPAAFMLYIVEFFRVSISKFYF
eukprot:gene3354-4205_t